MPSGSAVTTSSIQANCSACCKEAANHLLKLPRQTEDAERKWQTPQSLELAVEHVAFAYENALPSPPAFLSFAHNRFAFRGYCANPPNRPDNPLTNSATSPVLPQTPQSLELAVEHVAFAYENGQPVYTDFSLYCPRGTKLALVGTSGSGKSTLASLLSMVSMPSGSAVTTSSIQANCSACCNLVSVLCKLAVGTSGSGKSTLASLLVGFWQPQRGQICLGGIPLEAERAPEEKAESPQNWTRLTITPWRCKHHSDCPLSPPV